MASEVTPKDKEMTTIKIQRGFDTQALMTETVKNAVHMTTISQMMQPERGKSCPEMFCCITAGRQTGHTQTTTELIVNGSTITTNHPMIPDIKLNYARLAIGRLQLEDMMKKNFIKRLVEDYKMAEHDAKSIFDAKVFTRKDLTSPRSMGLRYENIDVLIIDASHARIDTTKLTQDVNFDKLFPNLKCILVLQGVPQ